MKKRFNLIWFALCIICFVLCIIACELGLGKSVDTLPPALSITYPPVSSSIRGTFVIAGNAEDETALSSVSVKLNSLNEKNQVSSFGPYEATIDPASKTWKVRIPNDPSLGTVSLSDGKYTITATAIDSAQRKTTLSDYNIIIDNTPPILILQRPATKGAEKPDPFGSELSFTGSTWDANDITINIDFYLANQAHTENPLISHSLSGVQQQWSVLFNNNSAVFKALQDKITSPSRPETYYFAVHAFDSAYQYTTPENPSFEKKGNASSYYYNYTDIATSLAVNETYPKLADLSAFDVDSTKTQGIPPSLIGKLSSLRINTTQFDTAKNGSFSIDPHNIYPSIKISAFPDPYPEPKPSDYQLAPYSTINILVEPSLNKETLNPDSIEIKIEACDINGLADSSTALIKSVRDGSLAVQKIGESLSLDYVVEKNSGTYLITITARDMKGFEARYNIYAFKINLGSPWIDSLSPDKSPQITKVNSSNGLFTVFLYGKGRDALAPTLKIYAEDGVTLITAAQVQLTHTSPDASELYTYEWSVKLPAVAEGSTVPYVFKLTTGNIVNAIRKVSYMIDNTLPRLSKIVSPIAISDVSSPAKGFAVTDNPLIQLRGFANEEDMQKTQIQYTSVDNISVLKSDQWQEASIDISATGSERGFTYNLDLPTVEGKYYVWVRFADDTYTEVLQNWSPAEKAFSIIYDKMPPVLAISNIDDKVNYTNKPITLIGTTSDSYSLLPLKVTYKIGSASIQTVTPTIAGSSWQAIIPLPLDGTKDGMYDITVTACDVAGRTTVLKRQVMADTIVPHVTISAPANNSYIQTASYTYKGEVRETGSGIKNLQLCLADPLIEANWIDISGNTIWSYPFDFGTLSEGEGKKAYIRAEDNAGNKIGYDNQTFNTYTIDTTNPIITEIAFIASTAYQNTAYAFSGEIEDANGLKALTYSHSVLKTDGSTVLLQKDKTITPAGFVVGGKKYNWTLDGNYAISGTHMYEFSIVDVVNRKTTLTRTVLVDIDSPFLEVSTITPLVSKNAKLYINGIVTIKGVTSDNDKVNTAQYTLNSTTQSLGSNASSWSFTIDTRTVPNGASLGDVLTFTVHDRAGNALSTTTQNNIKAFLNAYEIHQDTDIPVISINADMGVSDTSGITAVTNLFKSTDSLSGTISDDDGIAHAKITITQDATGTVVVNNENIIISSGSGAFTYPLTKLQLEGSYKVQIVVTDNALGTQKDSGIFFIGIDNAPPSLIITTADGQFWNTAFSVTGTVSDTNGLAASGALTIDGIPITPNGENWTHSIAKPTASENKTVTITAKDFFGKTSSKTFTYKFDLDAPDILVVSAPAAIVDKTKLLVVSGTAAETGASITQSALVAVQYAVVSGANATEPAFSQTGSSGLDKWISASGLTNWIANINITGERDGSYTLCFVSKDNNGNYSAVKKYTITADGVSPVLTETQLSGSYQKADFALGGTVTDVNGIASLTYRIDSAAAIPISIAANNTWTLGQTGIASGNYTYTLTATDNAGLQTVVSRTVSVDTTPPSASISLPASDGAYIKLSGSTRTYIVRGSTADTGSGVKTISLHINNESAHLVPAASAWNYEIDLSSLDENALSHTLNVTVEDNAGNSTVVTRQFILDKADPRALIAMPQGGLEGGTTKYNTQVVLGGTADDATLTVGRKAVSAKLAYTINGVQQAEIAITPAVADDSWTHAFTQDGQYDVTLTVLDVAGRTASTRTTYQIDKTVPTVEMVSFNSYAIEADKKVNGTVSFKAVAQDESGITGIRYFITTPAQVVAPAYNTTVGGNIVKALEAVTSISTTDLTNNTSYILWAVAKDNFTNESGVSLHFTVDQSSDAPIIDVTNAQETLTSQLPFDIQAAGNLFGIASNNKLFVTITDDDGIKTVSVSIKDKNAVEVLSSKPIDKTSAYRTSESISITLPAIAGIYSISITATDSRGETSFSSKVLDPFFVGTDDGTPNIAITAPQQGTFYSGTLAIKGTIKDASGFASPAISSSGSGTSASITTGSGTDTTWQDALTLPSSSGAYVQTYTLTDLWGQTAQVLFNFNVDAENPLLQNPSITSGSRVYINLPDNPYLRITGTAQDSGGSSVSEIKYIITQQSTPVLDAIHKPLDWSAWTTAGGLENWTANIDFSLKTQGEYVVYVLAKDGAGNYSAPYTCTAYADTDAPHIGAILPAAGSIYKENITVSGTASDVGGLKAVSASINGRAITNTGTINNWSFAIPIADGTLSADGNYTAIITAEDLSGKKTNSSYAFIKDITAPLITVSNIAQDDSTKIIDQNPKVLGSISDTTGIQSAQVSFEKYSGSTWTAVGGSKALSITSGSTLVNFSLDLASLLTNDLTDGLWRLTITALDNAKNTSGLVAGNQRVLTTAQFRIDRTDPTVVITKPVSSGSFVKKTDNLIVSGSALDTGGMEKVTIKLVLESNTVVSQDIPAASMPSGTWTHTFTTPFTASGTYTIIATAYDLAGRIREDKREIICDTDIPLISFISPFPDESSQTQNLVGSITVAGKTVDQAMNKMYYIIGGTFDSGSGTVTGGDNSNNWTEFGNAYNWSISFDSLEKIDKGLGILESAAIYTLPFHVKAEDMAGNISYRTLKIRIDTDIDKPTVSILSPEQDAKLGGKFMVSGSAQDNNFIYKVYMQVEVVGAHYDTIGAYKVLRGATADNFKTGTGKDATGAPAHLFTRIDSGSTMEESAWYEVSGTNAWKMVLNEFGEFNKQSINSFNANSITDEAITLKIRIMALDTKNSDGTPSPTNQKFGVLKEITIIVDQNIPSITEIDMPAQDGYVSGLVPMQFDLSDDVGIDEVMLSVNGKPFTIPSAHITKSNPNDGYYQTWKINTQLDTTDTAFVSGGSGLVIINLSVKEYATDGNPKTAAFTRRFSADNNAPNAEQVSGSYYINSAEYGRNTDGALNIIGEVAPVSGKANDANSGISQVIIYFTRTIGGNTYYYSMGGTTGVGVGRDTSGEINNTTYNFGAGAKPFPVALLKNIQTGKNGSIPQKYIVIDRLEGGNDGGETGDQDGYAENLRVDGTWYVNVNSTLLNDGYYDLHYVIIDKAGMPAYYQDKILVQNNKPLITGITLYTDVNGDGIINTSDDSANYERAYYSKAQFAATNFTVRNSKMKIAVNSVVSNTPATYTLQYPTTSGIKEISNATGIFDVPEFAADTSTNGASYTISIKDAIPLESGESLCKVTLKNTDSEKPTAKLYELQHTMQAPANNSYNNYNDTLALALKSSHKTGNAPSLIKYHSPTEKNILSGHIETRSDSRHDNTVLQDSDVSGIIILRGEAFDNQRISTVSLKIGSVTIPILTWDTTHNQLTPIAGAAIPQQELTLNGHFIEWSYAWDTSTITGRATNNATIDVIVNDSATIANTSVSTIFNGSNASDYNATTMDIVPYIRKISTRLSNVNKTSPSVYDRTALGHYPVYDKEVFTISGYNFSTNASVSLQGTPNVVSQNEIRFTLNATAVSGELKINVNGVDSINNSNNNTVLTNTLPNGQNNDLLTDDVYIDIWQFTRAAEPRDGEILQPEMKIGPKGEIGFAFVNGNFYFNMSGPDATGANWTSQRPYEQSFAPYYESAFAFDAQGTTYGLSTNQDANDRFSAYTSFFFNRIGGNALTMNSNYTGGTYRRRLESTTTSISPVQDTSVYRAQSPSLVTSMPNPSAPRNNGNNRTHVYLAYYDAVKKRISYRWGSVGETLEKSCTVNNLNINSTAHGLQVGDEISFTNFSGSVGVYNNNLVKPYFVTTVSNANNFEVSTTKGGVAVSPSNASSWSAIGGQLLDIRGGGNAGGNGAIPSDAAMPNYTSIADASTDAKPGKFVALDVVKTTGNDVVVMVWYDAENNCLWYTYNDNPQSDDSAQWQNNKIRIDSDGGWYCQVKTDSDGGIHIAYYSTVGADLKYAKLDSYNSTRVSPVTVDGYQLVGTQISLDVAKVNANQVPYITYYAPSNALAKVAYQVHFDSTTLNGSDSTDMYTGNWEISVVPTNKKPNDDKINVGVHKIGGILTAIPIVSGSPNKATFGDNISSTRVGGNGSRNPLVAYTIFEDSSLEMAQKK